LKRQWLPFLAILLLCMAPRVCTAATAPVPTLMQTDPPASTGTTPPELAPSASPLPRNWIQVGPVAFDAELLTLEERAEMIRDLQLSIMRTAMADYQIVSGLDTTREQPCYIGQSARFRQTSYGANSEEFWVTMTLVGILRGPVADDIAGLMVAQVFSADDVLQEGMEFVVLDFEISVVADDPTLQILFGMYDFQVISESGRAIPSPMLIGNVENFLTLVPSGSASGPLRVVLAVEKDTNPTILYHKEVWFSLLEPED